MTVFVTGGMDSGKTSFVRGLAVGLAARGLRVAGVVGPAKRERGQKTLYFVENLCTGFRRPLLRRTNLGPEVAPGGFAYGNSVLGRIKSGVAVVDEFGPIELAGGGYFDETRRLARLKGVDLIVVVRRGLVKAAAEALGLKSYLVKKIYSR